MNEEHELEELAAEPFLDLVPKSGWIKDYIDYTMWSEAPAAFHFFTACAVLGATVGRKAWFSKGYYKVYPNHQIILVAPTGKCRKTSALNLGIRLLQQLEGLNILANKSTPEALIQGLSSVSVEGNQIQLAREARGVLYAPELAVFLGKQKYNEGLIALLTDLFDNPDKWQASTKAGGKVDLNNVCLTFMGASTPDWLIGAIPQDAFGGGFMSRLLFIVQEDTPRCFPIPKVVETPPRLTNDLQTLWNPKTVPGEITFTNAEPHRWYSLWYAGSRKNIPEDEKMAGYHERKPDHLLRLSILIALSQGRTKIDTPDLMASLKVLDFLERQMLGTFKWLGVRPIGVDQERVLRTLRANGMTMSSGDLLRKLIFYMNAQQFRMAMETLTQAGLVKEALDLKTKMPVYTLLPTK